MITITTTPSKVSRIKTDVLLVGDSENEVQGEILNLELDWSCVVFMNPIKTFDGRWATFGRVWNEEVVSK